jgi:hypothetical protein
VSDDQDDQDKQYVGDVVREAFASGSKSQRPAVLLRTRHGDFVLRQGAGHPLVDPELDALVGKRLRVRGSVHRHMLTITTWQEVARKKA